MDPNFTFQFTALDARHLQPQVRWALEKRTELLSRQRNPRMWKLTDKLNSVEKVPQAVRENRRRRRRFLGLWNWLLGAVLLIPGLLESRTLLLPLLVGAACWGSGVCILWRNRRRLLGVLSLVKGLILCMGVLGDYAQLHSLLILGIVDVVMGAAALLTRKQVQDPFDRAAEQLLAKRNAQEGLAEVRLTFSPEGMFVTRTGDEEESHMVPYAAFEVVLETQELLLPVYENTVTILQKKDLLTGTLPRLQEFLAGQVPWVTM